MKRNATLAAGHEPSDWRASATVCFAIDGAAWLGHCTAVVSMVEE